MASWFLYSKYNLKIYCFFFSKIDQNTFWTDTCFLSLLNFIHLRLLHWCVLFIDLFVSHFCVCLFHAVNYFQWHFHQSLVLISPFYVSQLNLYVSRSNLSPTLVFHFYKLLDNMAEI